MTKKPMDSAGLWTSVDSLALRAHRCFAPVTADHPCPQPLDSSRPALSLGLRPDHTDHRLERRGISLLGIIRGQNCHLCPRSKMSPMSRVAHFYPISVLCGSARVESRNRNQRTAK